MCSRTKGTVFRHSLSSFRNKPVRKNDLSRRLTSLPLSPQRGRSSPIVSETTVPCHGRKIENFRSTTNNEVDRYLRISRAYIINLGIEFAFARVNSMVSSRIEVPFSFSAVGRRQLNDLSKINNTSYRCPQREKTSPGDGSFVAADCSLHTARNNYSQRQLWNRG